MLVGVRVAGRSTSRCRRRREVIVEAIAASPTKVVAGVFCGCRTVLACRRQGTLVGIVVVVAVVRAAAKEAVRLRSGLQRGEIPRVQPSVRQARRQLAQALRQTRGGLVPALLLFLRERLELCGWGNNKAARIRYSQRRCVRTAANTRTTYQGNWCAWSRLSSRPAWPRRVPTLLPELISKAPATSAPRQHNLDGALASHTYIGQELRQWLGGHR